MKTIAQQLRVKDFPFRIEDSQGNEIYSENSYGYIRDDRNIPEYTIDELIEKIDHFKLKTNNI